MTLTEREILRLRNIRKVARYISYNNVCANVVHLIIWLCAYTLFYFIAGCRKEIDLLGVHCLTLK